MKTRMPIVFVAVVLLTTSCEFLFGPSGGSEDDPAVIEVFQLPTEIVAGGSYDFADTEVNGSTDVEFTIRNTGDETLSVQSVSVSGDDSAVFTATDPSTSTIAGGGAATVTITFAPTTIGEKTASITILSDSSVNDLFTFTLTGTAIAEGTGGGGVTDLVPTTISLSFIEDPLTFMYNGDTYDAIVKAVDDTGAVATGFDEDVELTVTGGIALAVYDTDSTLIDSDAPFIVPGAEFASGEFTGKIEIQNLTADVPSLTISAVSGDLTSGSVTVAGYIKPTVLVVTPASQNAFAGSGLDVTVEAQDPDGFVAASFAEDVTIALDDTTFSSGTATIAADSFTDGVATGTFVVDTITTPSETATITATAETTTITGTATVATWNGTALTSTDFGSGLSLTDAVYNILPADPTDPSIEVGGDILVGAGVELRIFEGASLNMGGGKITVNGTLRVLGTDEKRVLIESPTTTGWQGIFIGQGAEGIAEAYINGAYLTDLGYDPLGSGDNEGNGIQLGQDSSLRAGNFTLTNSRIEMNKTDTYSYAVYLSYLGGSKTITIENNIFLTNGSSYRDTPVYDRGYYHAAANDVTISHNTFATKAANNNAAIYISGATSNVSTYTIERNLTAGTNTSDGAGLWQFFIDVYSSTALTYINYNVSKTYDRWDTDGNAQSVGDSYTESIDNLWLERDDESGGDTLIYTWDQNTYTDLWQGYATNDFRLAKTGGVPSLTQVSNYTSMAGCLSNDNSNQVGAYGNGGYPPLPSEK